MICNHCPPDIVQPKQLSVSVELNMRLTSFLSRTYIVLEKHELKYLAE